MQNTGFYHPDRGYWQVTGDVPDHIRDGWPAGTVEVPLKPAADHEWDEAAQKWVFVDPLTVDQHKEAAIAAVVAEHAKMLESLSGNYTSAERDTWAMQLEWARGYLADQNAAHASLLAGMVPPSQATTQAKDAQMMADKIVAKANQYAQLVKIAQRTKAEALAAIDAAATVADLDAVLTNLKGLEAAAVAELANA